MTLSQYFDDNFAGIHFNRLRFCSGDQPVSRATRGCMPLTRSLGSFERKMQSAVGHPYKNEILIHMIYKKF